MKRSEFQIRRTQLLSLDYAINENFTEKDISFDIKTEVKVMNSKSDKNKAKVILTLNIFDEEILNESPFYLKLSIAGEFFWSNDLNDQMVETLLKSNAPAILLSYSRPFISQLTSFSGYPPLILPLLNFIDSENSENKT